MHKVLVNRLGGLSLPRKSVVRLIDSPDMTLDVYRGRKTTIQYNTIIYLQFLTFMLFFFSFFVFFSIFFFSLLFLKRVGYILSLAL